MVCKCKTNRPWAVTFSWLKMTQFLVSDQDWSVRRCVYKSLLPAVTIFDTLVNRRTQTDAVVVY